MNKFDIFSKNKKEKKTLFWRKQRRVGRFYFICNFIRHAGKYISFITKKNREINLGGVYVKLMVEEKVAKKISSSPQLSNRKVQRINRKLCESLE